jgi:hypothetical protein
MKEQKKPAFAVSFFYTYFPAATITRHLQWQLSLLQELFSVLLVTTA